jgi:hypothetical protein
MLLLEGTRGIERIFMTSAVAADASTIATLQKGGFVYLTYSYTTDKPFVAPTATLANEDGSTGLKYKTIYPVFISRKQPETGEQNPDFKPIGDDGIISIIADHGFECFVTEDSYYQDGSTYPNIAAGDALKICNNTATSDRPKLIQDNSGAGTFATTVAYALSAAVNGKLRILWL